MCMFLFFLHCLTMWENRLSLFTWMTFCFKVINMSEELALLEVCLKEAESISDEVEVPETLQTCTETAIQSLIESLRDKEFPSALAQVKAFR